MLFWDVPMWGRMQSRISHVIHRFRIVFARLLFITMLHALNVNGTTAIGIVPKFGNVEPKTTVTPVGRKGKQVTAL